MDFSIINFDDSSADSFSALWTWHKVSVSGESPVARCSHGACSIGDALIIVGGGHVTTVQHSRGASRDEIPWVHHSDIWSFSPLKLAWQRLDINEMSSCLPPRRGHCTAYCPARHALFVFGGTSGGVDNTSLLDDTWTFDLKARLWARVDTLGPGPLARRGACAWIQGGRFFVLGGYTCSDSLPFDSQLWMLELSTQRWFVARSFC